MIERISTWEPALAAVIEDARERAHVYGEHDCCTFFSEAVIAMTGFDPMADFRGRYASKDEAIEALATIGAGSLEATLDQTFPECEIGRAQRGDIVLMDGGDMDTVGVVMGRYAWTVSEQGLVRLPVRYWRKAWSVG